MGRRNLLTEEGAKALHTEALSKGWNYVRTAKEHGIKDITLYKTWRKFGLEMPNHKRQNLKPLQTAVVTIPSPSASLQEA